MTTENRKPTQADRIAALENMMLAMGASMTELTTAVRALAPATPATPAPATPAKGKGKKASTPATPAPATPALSSKELSFENKVVRMTEGIAHILHRTNDARIAADKKPRLNINVPTIGKLVAYARTDGFEKAAEEAIKRWEAAGKPMLAKPEPKKKKGDDGAAGASVKA
jgi:hypothetical protein